MRTIYTLLAALLLCALVRAQNTVVDIIVNSADHGTLEAAVIAADLDSVLATAGPFTVFAPTDAAFAALPEGTIEALLADPSGDLTDILLYHVLGADVRSTDLSDGQTAMTLNGEDITVTISGDSVFINNALVTTADVVADNGVVHVINAVLLPPPTTNTITDIVVNSDAHTILETVLVEAGLDSVLAGEGEFTVFAPTDAAFSALPQELILELLSSPEEELTDILLYHVVGGIARSTDLSDGQMVTTLNGKAVTVTIRNDSVFINDAYVSVADIEADNGVVHVIDAVLLPPSNTVVDIIVNSENHNTLEAAVVAAGLAETLAGDGPFTVFAPTDAAFDLLPDGTIDALLADPSGDLTDILLYHVLSGDVRSTDLADGQTAVTLNGKVITVTIRNDSAFINNAYVSVADVEADNGVVHVIDAVLLPPTTVMDIIADSENHNTLEAAISAAGLDATLKGAGPFTVFAPTDAAFALLPEGTVDALLADPMGDLTDILLYHVVGAEALSTGLSDGQIVTTLNGKTVTVTISNDSVFINNAYVSVADIETSNGVVHVIDAVLLPPSITITDIVVNSEVHTILETAVVAAGLAETLAGEGNFTVFAPTDAAFAALPSELIDTLLAAPEGELTNILLYHVLGTEVRSTDLSDGQTAATLNSGKTISISLRNDSAFVNDAYISVVDIVADNGVVHVIDAVLLPPSTVVDIIVASEDHNTLEAAVAAAGLIETLNGAGPFTVFAPTDAAFAALPEGTVDALLADPTGDLTKILLYHVIGANVLSTDLTDGQMATTLNGQDVTVTISNDSVFINNALVTVADITTDNGVVHVIDAVLLPNLTSVRPVNEAGLDIKVFPNPATEYITVTLDKQNINTANIRLWNIQGQFIKQWQLGRGVHTLNVSDVPAGSYFLEFRVNNSRYQQQVMIK